MDNFDRTLHIIIDRQVGEEGLRGRGSSCPSGFPETLFLVFQPQEVRDEVKMLGVRP